MITLIAAVTLTVNLPVPAGCNLILVPTQNSAVQALRCGRPGRASSPATAKTILIQLQLPTDCVPVLTGGNGKQTLACQ